MGQALGVLAAAFVGLITWGFSLAVANGNPIGKTGGLEAGLFLAPILSVMVPLAFKALDKSPAVAAWIAALAPIAGVANMGLFLALTVSTPGTTTESTLPAILGIVGWIIPAGYFIKKAMNSVDSDAAP